MKENIVRIGILFLKLFMKMIYWVFKRFPVNENKIIFCSRQESDIPLDFKLIQDALAASMPSLVCISICKRIEGGLKDYTSFAMMTLKSMYHMATGKVCVIDTYWPAVSLLKHRPDMKVVQIWHSIGKLKQSGHQTVGKSTGRNAEYAYALRMHENYDYIIAGAPVWNRYYCESFGVTDDKLLNYGLPRIDYLIKTEQENRERFFDEYPELKGRKIILYTPTFRRNMKSRWDEIVKNVKWSDEYALLVKKHPGGLKYIPEDVENVYYPNDWKSIDLLAVCDFVVTDYSAISLEAAVLAKPTYWWIYDYDEYRVKNGLNIDIKEEMYPYAFNDIGELAETLKTTEYDKGFTEAFRNRFLPAQLGDSTEKITELIIDIIQNEGRPKSDETNSDNGRWKGQQVEGSSANT